MGYRSYEHKIKKIPRLTRGETIKIRLFLFILKIIDYTRYKEYNDIIEKIIQTEALSEERMDCSFLLFEQLKEGDVVINLDLSRIGKVVQLYPLSKEIKVCYEATGYYGYEACDMHDIGKVLDIVDNTATYMRLDDSQGLIMATSKIKQSLFLSRPLEVPIDPNIVEDAPQFSTRVHPYSLTPEPSVERMSTITINYKGKRFSHPAAPWHSRSYINGYDTGVRSI